jgi:hypothetical protein
MILPFLVVILVIVAINHIYYSDVKPKNLKDSKQIEKRLDKRDTAQNYLNRYIKKSP